MIIKSKDVFTAACMAMILTVSSTGCKKSAVSDKDAVTSPHTLFLGTDKGEVWNTNDGTNFRSFFTVDNSQVYDIVSTKDAMYYTNGLIYRFKAPDDGNLVLPKGSYNGDYTENLNNMLYCKTENRIYVPLESQSTVAYSEDLGQTWNLFNASNYPNHVGAFPQSSIVVEELVNRGLYFWTVNKNLYFKEYNKDELEKKDVYNTNFNGATYINMSSTDEELIFWDTDATTNIKIQFVNPNNYNVVRAIDPPTSQIVYSIIPANNSYVYVCTSNGLYGLDIRTLIYTPIRNNLPSGVAVYDVSVQNSIYRSGNTEIFTYVATSDGLYLSRDNTKTFTKIFEGVITSLSD